MNLKQHHYMKRLKILFQMLNFLMLKKIKISQTMNDFTKIISQAKEIEAKIKDSQEKIKNIEATGVSGNNSVKITINGDSEIVNIEISDEAHNEDKNILIDLIIAAFNNAKSQLKSKTTEEISKATGGLGIPGFKWPL